MNFKHPRQQALFTLLLLVVSLNSHANDAALSNFKATYNANVKGFNVQATRELRELENKSFELSFKASSIIASIDEASSFTWKNNIISPISYRYSQTTLGKKRYRTLSFDKANQRIISTNKDSTVTINAHEWVLDKLNYQLQLQQDLRQAKYSLTYKVADKNSIKDYHFEVIGEEDLDTNVGKLKTLKVKVIHENKDKATYIWFAKHWEHLIVQLEQYKSNKEVFTLKLVSAEVNNIAVSHTNQQAAKQASNHTQKVQHYAN